MRFLTSWFRRRSSSFGGLLAALVLFGAVLNRWYGHVLRHPADYLFGGGGDALKNYYTLAYYLRYDTGLRFSGMNYPWGEHVVFTDNQPVLALAAKMLQNLGLLGPDGAVGLINFLMLAAQLLAVGLLYGIARRARLPAWYAAGLAVLVVALSPQHERLLAHYGLAYSCLFPLGWYLLLRLWHDNRRPAWGWALPYVATTALAGMLHPYHLLITTVFALATWAVWLVRSKREAGWALRAAGMALVLLLPLALFQGWLAATDAVSDRPDNPWGFLLFHTTWQSVFLPGWEPWHSAWQAAFHSADITWEGTVYVGLVAALALLLVLVRAGRRLLGGLGWRALHPAEPAAFYLSGWAAVLALLFASAYPFRWGLEWMVPYLGPLRQFRGLGRFAWSFYYVFSLYAGYYFYLLFRYLRQRRVAAVAAAVLALVVVVWLAEGWVFYRDRAQRAQANANAFVLLNPDQPYRNYLFGARREAADFQAVLPLPYFHVGSEKFSIERSGEAMSQGMRLSLELGLPLAAVMLSRTSTAQALQLVQLLGHPLLPKPLAGRLPSAKPLLLMVTHEALTANEAALLRRATLLYTAPDITLYELPVAAFASTAPAALARFALRRDSLTALAGGVLVAGPTAGIQALAFDGQPAPAAFGTPLGASAGQGLARVAVLAPLPADTASYEISAWCWAGARAALPVMVVRQRSSAGTDTRLAETNAANSTDVAGAWVRTSAVVRPLPGGAPLEIWFDRDDFVVDDLLVRPRAATVYQRRANGTLWLNNYPLLPPPAVLPANPRP